MLISKCYTMIIKSWYLITNHDNRVIVVLCKSIFVECLRKPRSKTNIILSNMHCNFFYLVSILIKYDVINYICREFYSLQKNVRYREKKRLVFYMIYAWGLPFILAVICIIMDFASKNLPKILQPQFRAGDCWFAGK